MAPVPVCPTKSITSKSGTYKIDAETCAECEGEADAPQCVDVCPSGDRCIVYV